MKIAYLIAAHTDASKLKRLIDSLNSKDAFFFIHIDKKVDIDPFIKIIHTENVKFIEKRHKNYWGSYSHVETIMSLIEEAFLSKYPFDRIVMLSGLDYPIFSNTDIINEFKNNAKKQYLIGYNITKGNSLPQKNKIKRYSFFNFSNKWIKRFLKYLFIILPIRKKDQIFFNNKWNNVYFGSDWWALTYDCAYYIYEMYKKEKKQIKNYFHYTLGPSELFMHTIVFNSPFNTDIINYPSREYTGLVNLTPLHYIEYGREIKIFGESDYEILINSGKMFFRKATTQKSTLLLDRIDKKRQEHNELNPKS